MEVLYTVSDLQKAIAAYQADSKTIGFVPTMGALHEGHISLVDQCCQQNDICIVSIFVNPTQFNNLTDLEKYPRTIEKDTELLAVAGVDIVFVPSVDEIYPKPDTRQFDFGQLDKVMEGKFRPGHFNGVAQVVSRLFDIVKPDKAYFGQKDFQQLAIIRDMVHQYHIPLEILAVPIMREKSGLAMSSRNQRLTLDQALDAANIYKILVESRILSKRKDVQDVLDFVEKEINKMTSLHVEYFEIVDGNTLQPISQWSDTSYSVGCITVFCGDIRLIDNIVYYESDFSTY